MNVVSDSSSCRKRLRRRRLCHFDCAARLVESLPTRHDADSNAIGYSTSLPWFHAHMQPSGTLPVRIPLRSCRILVGVTSVYRQRLHATHKHPYHSNPRLLTSAISPNLTHTHNHLLRLTSFPDSSNSPSYTYPTINPTTNIPITHLPKSTCPFCLTVQLAASSLTPLFPRRLLLSNSRLGQCSMLLAITQARTCSGRTRARKGKCALCYAADGLGWRGDGLFRTVLVCSVRWLERELLDGVG
ncbi:hypothetical protein FB567DRAFT_269991 [Paraphoma chrysanthemicola]|uniref:Uncharacterized protein n=1 Tax=Paraphoma chrysanthemicola TaxID=798071 RepID=A0A8K0W1S7_9PLEO|nr:hypothetical protein FB567DRAFT_269991 [Paraphoma chrysanthemicola]